MSTRMCDFFSFPFEIRREIYTDVWAPKLKLHVFFEDGRPRVSPCLGAALGKEKYDARQPTEEEKAPREEPSAWGECGTFRPVSKDTWRYLHRLQSSWGPHFRCEEVPKGMRLCNSYVGMQRYNCVSMLLVCRQMNAECIELIKELLEIHVTDLDTALYLANFRLVYEKDPSHIFCGSGTDLPNVIFRHIRSLSLCLFTEPDTYHQISAPQPRVHNDATTRETSSEISSDEIPAGAISKHRAWRLIWPGLASLPHLRQLSIWLDHNSQTWSEIDERALLLPLSTTHWNSQARITVHMPNLRRDRIQPERHFHTDGAGEENPCFAISRRTRPEEIAPDGGSCIVIAPDVEEALKTEEYGMCFDLADLDWYVTGYYY